MSEFKPNKTVDCHQNNSFDVRIYDDLCEDLLQWLTFDDRIRLTGVSKQFQICLQSLNSKQIVVYVDSELENNLFNQKNVLNEVMAGTDILFTVDIERFGQLLKQFPKLRKVLFGKFTEICNTDEVLDTIIKNCDQLKTIRLHFDYSSQNQLITDLGLKFGQTLEELHFIDSYGTTLIAVQRTVIQSCPHINTISNVNFFSLFGNNGVVVKNLIKAEELYNITSQPLFEIFIDQNLTLKYLEMDLEMKTIEEFRLSLLKLSQLKDLEFLAIDFLSLRSFDKQIVKSLETIGLKCKQLKSLTITVLDRETKTSKIKSFNTEIGFKGLKTFLNLKKLTIFSVQNQSINSEPNPILDLKSLNCHQLTDLDLTSDQITDQFFDSIETVVPKLKSLRISVKDRLTDKALESIAKLKNLKRILIRRFTGDDFTLITDSGVVSVINGCNYLFKFQIIYRTSITEKTMRALIQKAIERPKMSFEYEFYRIESQPKLEDIIENMGQSVNNIKFISF